ncbi:hypothetical protein AAG906_026199 [Vitis piasezkii]
MAVDNVLSFFVSSPNTSPSLVEMPRFSLNAEDGDRYMKMINEALLSTGLGTFSLSSSIGDSVKIHEAANPCGAESLPPGIIEPYSDFYLHGLQGNPSKDLVEKPKYLLALAVGYPQKDMVNSIVSKFAENFSVILFHYDEKGSEWDQFEWSRRAIHISVKKQTKFTKCHFYKWYAKHFLHPNIVAPYDYIFLWDEDLGVKHFLQGAVEAFSSRNNSVLVIMVTNPGTEVWRMYHHQRMWKLILKGPGVPGSTGAKLHNSTGIMTSWLSWNSWKYLNSRVDKSSEKGFTVATSDEFKKRM